MEQVAQYQAGERDYALIKGGTGPLVYPAGHVYIYSFLYDLTNQGKDILTGQWIFMGLYLATLAVVGLCYREARVTLHEYLSHSSNYLIFKRRRHRHTSSRYSSSRSVSTASMCSVSSMTHSLSSSSSSPSTAGRSANGRWARQHTRSALASK